VTCVNCGSDRTCDSQKCMCWSAFDCYDAATDSCLDGESDSHCGSWSEPCVECWGFETCQSGSCW
jgi:hypothetical protein